MAGYGVAFAVASLSCTIGPFLAVTGIALRGGCW
jgi:cytochrome c-type biogenesis protein